MISCNIDCWDLSLVRRSAGTDSSHQKHPHSDIADLFQFIGIRRIEDDPEEVVRFVLHRPKGDLDAFFAEIPLPVDDREMSLWFKLCHHLIEGDFDALAAETLSTIKFVCPPVFAAFLGCVADRLFLFQCQVSDGIEVMHTVIISKNHPAVFAGWFYSATTAVGSASSVDFFFQVDAQVIP